MYHILQNLIIGGHEYEIGDVVDLSENPDLPALMERQLVSDRPPHRDGRNSRQ